MSKYCVLENIKDISKDRLRYKEDKYIKRFDTVKKGLNTYYAFGEKCEHNVRRVQCIECKGSSICEHHRQRSQCRDCGGSSICEHDRLKRQCRDCGGNSICEHSKQKSQCSDCGGKSICEHNRQRSQCKVCSPSVCIKCLKVYAGKSKLKRHQKKCSIDQTILTE